jgi:hypothetical protein
MPNVLPRTQPAPLQRFRQHPDPSWQCFVHTGHDQLLNAASIWSRIDFWIEEQAAVANISQHNPAAP